jgi:hypothetical protein
LSKEDGFDKKVAVYMAVKENERSAVNHPPTDEEDMFTLTV